MSTGKSRNIDFSASQYTASLASTYQTYKVIHRAALSIGLVQTQFYFGSKLISINNGE